MFAFVYGSDIRLIIMLFWAVVYAICVMKDDWKPYTPIYIRWAALCDGGPSP